MAKRCVQFVHIVADGISFAFQKTVDRVAEFGIFQPVPGMRGGGNEAACEFVFSLRTAFKHLQAMGNRVFDALLVTGFKVQPGHVFQRAPMAAIQALTILDAE